MPQPNRHAKRAHSQVFSKLLGRVQAIITRGWNAYLLQVKNGETRMLAGKEVTSYAVAEAVARVFAATHGSIPFLLFFFSPRNRGTSRHRRHRAGSNLKATAPHPDSTATNAAERQYQ
jgi:hypothetical protein